MKKLIAALVAFTAAYCCFAAAKTTVSIKGSDTMVILAQRWAESYGKVHADVVMQVTGGGSGTGIAALINGTTDICTASRPMKSKEMEQLKAKTGSNPVEIKVAIDGIAIYVEESNTMTELTLAQLKAIYTGATTNWKAVGGPDAKIVAYGRENSSGTYEFFREHVLEGADYAPQIQSLPGTAAVVNAVSKDKNGIGYGGAAYGKGIKVLKVRKDATSAAFAPDSANIRAGSYPVSRFLFMYTARKPEGNIKAFIDYALSDAGQKLATEVGYFAIR